MKQNLTNFANVFSRFGDLVLAFLVVCIIGLLIIPLPTADFIEGDPAEFGEYLSEKTGLPVQTPSDKKKERQQ